MIPTDKTLKQLVDEMDLREKLDKIESEIDLTKVENLEKLHAEIKLEGIKLNL